MPARPARSWRAPTWNRRSAPSFPLSPSRRLLRAAPAPVLAGAARLSGPLRRVHPPAMLAITLYLTLKSLHVLAAITWVGGAITTQAFAIRTTRSEDPERLVAFTRDVEFIGQRM